MFRGNDMRIWKTQIKFETIANSCKRDSRDSSEASASLFSDENIILGGANEG